MLVGIVIPRIKYKKNYYLLNKWCGESSGQGRRWLRLWQVWEKGMEGATERDKENG